MKIEMRPIDSIKPYAKNPRRTEAAIDAVGESIVRFGFRQPIVVDKSGVIIVGETRWKGAKRKGLTEVPVHVATDLTKAQARAYRIADNKVAELAQWDPKMLGAELLDLSGDGIDWKTLGFDADDLQRLLGDAVGAPGMTDPNRVPKPPEKPKSRRGDVYALGDHRLMCGDSADPGDLDTLLGGKTIQLVNADPPYNVKVFPQSEAAKAAGNSLLNRASKGDKPRQMKAKDRALAGDFISDDDFSKRLSGWFGNAARVLDAGRSFYIWGGYANVANYPPALKEHGLFFAQTIIWVKEHPVFTRKDFMGNHEWCFYGWKIGKPHKFLGPNNVSDTWTIKKINPAAMVHLTEKPPELALRAIQYSSRPGENVLDLFGGSGSTLIACEQAGRCAMLMEIDPAYCDVIVERWEKYTGRKATLERTERPAGTRRRPGRAAKKKTKRRRNRDTVSLDEALQRVGASPPPMLPDGALPA